MEALKMRRLKQYTRAEIRAMTLKRFKERHKNMKGKNAKNDNM